MGEADDIPDLDIDDAGAEAMPKAKAAKGPPVLPWMRVPIGVQPGTGVALERVGGLVPELALALKNELHFTELFPVQSVVWQQTAGGASTLHDVCVNSPTGSGKTLAYALPVINGIIARRSATSRSAPSLPTLGTSVHYLQALVVLPTRDLAAQVFKVFDCLCPAVGLRAALAAAQSGIDEEATQLVGGGGNGGGGGGNGGGCLGGADVVVATPGRLMTHLQATPGFGLSHLKYLVIDEADRLLRQSYQGWLPYVMDQLARRHVSVAPNAAAPSSAAAPADALSASSTDQLLEAAETAAALGAPGSVAEAEGEALRGEAVGSDAGMVEPPAAASTSGAGFTSSSTSWGGPLAGLLPGGSLRPVKLIVSATLTRDPSKLQRLQLHCPRFIAAVGPASAAAAAVSAAAAVAGAGSGDGAKDETAAAAAAAAAAGGGEGGSARYQLPKSLQEFKLVCPAARKPLLLLALLRQLAPQPTLVFASSLEATHKLYLMLCAAHPPGLGDFKAVEFAGHMTAAQRSDSLSRFRRGEATVMVASDAMTRGMDLENVLNVVNYDAPVYAKTYVHRAGRTARAGRFGRVFTLLRDEEVRHFKDMLRKADNNFVKDHKMKPEEVNALKPQLGAALAQVQELLALEQQQQQQQQALAAGGGGSVAAGRGSSATAAATRATGGGIGASNGNKQRGDATGPLADSPVEPRAKRAKSTGLS